MTALLVAVLGASLLGSPHCAGMCGGLVALYSGQAGAARGAGHLAYNLGRLLTYVALGAGAGALGSLLDLAGRAAGAQRGAQLVASALIVALGAHALLSALGARVPALAAPPLLKRLAARSVAAGRALSPVRRAALLGLATGLLPCGWLYAFAVTAAGTGAPLAGAGVMAAFWAGTLPLLVALGVSVHHLSRPLRRALPVVSAAALLLVGGVTLAQRVRESPSATSSIAAPVSPSGHVTGAAPACHAGSP